VDGTGESAGGGRDDEDAVVVAGEGREERWWNRKWAVAALEPEETGGHAVNYM